MNVDRLICGLAVPFDAAPDNGPDDGLRFTRDSLRTFIDSGMGLTLRWDHGSHIEPVVRRFGNIVGVTYESRIGVGAARRFAAVEIDGGPSGMLALGELDESATGDKLLADITHRRITGLSLAGGFADDGITIRPTELSILHKGAHSSARIIGVGAEALARWELLTREVLANA